MLNGQGGGQSIFYGKTVAPVMYQRRQRRPGFKHTGPRPMSILYAPLRNLGILYPPAGRLRLDRRGRSPAPLTGDEIRAGGPGQALTTFHTSACDNYDVNLMHTAGALLKDAGGVLPNHGNDRNAW